MVERPTVAENGIKVGDRVVSVNGQKGIVLYIGRTPRKIVVKLDGYRYAGGYEYNANAWKVDTDALDA